LIKGECRKAKTNCKSSAERKDHCNSNKMTGNIINKAQPVALCKIDTKALMGKRMVNKFRFLGRFFLAGFWFMVFTI
jgi:hypothetical protein